MSGLLSYFEPEELVGSHWHRLTEGRSSTPHFPAAKVAFPDISAALAVFFRGLGGAAAVKLTAGVAITSHHRLPLKLRIMLGREKVAIARRNGQTLILPAELDVFAEARLNRMLYFWLTAFFCEMTPAANLSDPLQRDIDLLRRVRLTLSRLRAVYPGLAQFYAEVAPVLAAQRPARRLPEQEADIECAIAALLSPGRDGGTFWPVIQGLQPLSTFRAARSYAPPLPVALWGDYSENKLHGENANSDVATPGNATDTQDIRQRSAKREPSDQTQRKDYLALNRYEKLLSMVESLNIHRQVEDDDADSAAKAFEDSETIQLSTGAKAPSTRLKAELDLPSAPLNTNPEPAAKWSEWDYNLGGFRPDYCTIHSKIAAETGEVWQIDAACRRRIAKIRKQFDALRPQPEKRRGETDGLELDLDAVVRSQIALASGSAGSERVYVSTLRRQRDICVGILADTSLSTDAWLHGHRVLDVEKEALLVLTNALTACGDQHAIYAFNSKKRSAVDIHRVKDFHENAPERVERRIGALHPANYTRIGAAIRYSARQISLMPQKQKLLLVVTDGKPNDIDHYEGRYGIEDTRHAILEARLQGITVFGITVDTKAQDYFPVLFGRGGYAIVGAAETLPAACLALYRRLSSRQ